MMFRFTTLFIKDSCVRKHTVSYGRLPINIALLYLGALLNSTNYEMTTRKRPKINRTA